MRSKLIVVLALAWATICHAVASAAAAEPVLTPLVAEVVAEPWAVEGSDGARHLVYEIRFGNVTDKAAELRRIQVQDWATGVTLATLEGSALAERFSVGNARGQAGTTLGAGQYGFAFMHVRLKEGQAVPSRISHVVEAELAVMKETLTMRVADTDVITRRPPVLGPPLTGAGYLVGDGCCDSIRHVRALLPIDGVFALAQRFAIDWERVNSDNRLIAGDPKKVEDYVIFGRDVLAVRDGVVVDSRNDLAEQVPGALPSSIPLAEADGNFVVLDIGDGFFVLYAHMQPGSVTVRKGDAVKKGAVLGKVGNTGNSQAPHLHLHVMDGPSALKANGVPYVFDAFSITGLDEAGTADFDEAEATGKPLTLTPLTPPRAHQNMLPLDLSVVDF